MPQFAAAIIVAIVMMMLQSGQKKPKKFKPQPQPDRLRQVIEPTASRKLIYGEQRVSGTVVHMEATDDKQFLHVVVALAGHEIEAIRTIYINEFPIYEQSIDGSGDVTSGKYSGLVRIKKHLGTDAQTADTDLVADITDWTTNHRLRGIAYVYVRLQFNQDVFPSAIPNISAWVKGKKCKDTREVGDPSLWTTNPTLILRDYLTTTTDQMGMGFLEAEIDDTYFEAAANICDQEVTVTDIGITAGTVNTDTDTIDLDVTGSNPLILQFQTGDKVDVTSTGSVPSGLSTGHYVIMEQEKHDNNSTPEFFPRLAFATSYANALAGTKITITDVGSGTITITKKNEPRFTASGVFDTAKKPMDNIDELVDSMGGLASHVGGVWIVHAGAWRTPTIDYDEDDLRVGDLTIRTRHGRKDRFNRVKGTYFSPLNSSVEADYPPVVNSSYVTADNNEILWADFDFPFTTRPHTAQRLAKIILEKHRQQIVVNGKFNLSAYRSQVGDVIRITNVNAGWVNKEFEVDEWELVTEEGEGDAPFFGIDMVLSETASANYDWANGEETVTDPAPNTNLPNPFEVTAITGLSVSTEFFADLVGAQNLSLRVAWSAATDFFVTQDGTVEIEFKKSADDDWSPSYYVTGSQLNMLIPQVEDEVSYDVRVRAKSYLGVRSAFNTVLNYVAGSSISGTSDTTDYGFVTQSSAQTIDYGLSDGGDSSIGDVWATVYKDYGGIVAGDEDIQIVKGDLVLTGYAPTAVEA